MRIEIVSPEVMLYSGDGDMVIARSTQGEFGVLKDHEPVLAHLAYGELRVYHGAQVRERFAIYGGFLAMRENVVRVLSDDAEYAADIDFDAARDELEAVAIELEDDPDNEPLRRRYDRARVQVSVTEEAGVAGA